MVRDMQKILETIKQNEEEQKKSRFQLIDALTKLSQTTRELGKNTGQTVMALDGKINVIKDFIVKQAEEDSPKAGFNYTVWYTQRVFDTTGIRQRSTTLFLILSWLLADICK